MQLSACGTAPRLPHPKRSFSPLAPQSASPGPVWRVAKNSSGPSGSTPAQPMPLVRPSTSAALAHTCQPSAQRSATVQPTPVGLPPSSPADRPHEGRERWRDARADAGDGPTAGACRDVGEARVVAKSLARPVGTADPQRIRTVRARRSSRSVDRRSRGGRSRRGRAAREEQCCQCTTAPSRRRVTSSHLLARSIPHRLRAGNPWCSGALRRLRRHDRRPGERPRRERARRPSVKHRARASETGVVPGDGRSA